MIDGFRSVAAAAEKQRRFSGYLWRTEMTPGADHRLTVENVRQMFAVERELLKLLKEVPDLETRIGELRIWL